MKISWNRSLKTGLATAGAVAAFAAVFPATASAGIVDDALARVPAGQISCEQANQYWTTEAEYNSIRAQAQAVALVHPRGGEISDALARIDEAANRCGLKGGGNAAPAPDNGGGNGGAPAPDNGGGNGGAPATNGGGTGGAPATNGPVFSMPVPQGTPTVSVPVADFATVVIPDVAAIVDDARGQLATGSSMPFAELLNVEIPDVGQLVDDARAQLPAGSSF